MLNFIRGGAIAVLVLVPIGVASAAEPTVFSGPQLGERLPALNVVLAYDGAQAEINLVEAAGGKATMLILVHGANRPAARLTRVLMNYAEMRDADEMYAAMVWLDDDRTAAQQYLVRAISWWGVGLPVGVAVDGAEGPGSYGLNRHVNVTVLVANKNRVTANFALVQPSETDAPMILKEVVKLIGGQVPAQPEVVFLSVPTRKPDDAKWQTAPQEVPFRRLVCRLLAALDEATVDAAARDIEAFVGGNVERREQLVRVAEILSQGRTRLPSIPAAKYLRQWQAWASSSADPPAAQRQAEPTSSNMKHSAVSVPVLFDFGTATSPVASSSLQVTNRDNYDPIRGFGWITDQQQAFDRDKPLAELRHGGNPMRPDLLYKAHATALNRDGVAATQDMRFRINVKPGNYRVHVWLGDLHQSLESLALDANQTTIGTGISAKHLIGRSQPEATGLYRLLRFDVDAAQDCIDLRFYGDNAKYERDQRRYDAWFPDGTRVASYLAGGLDPKRRLKFDPQGPFTRNSVLAVRVDIARQPMFAWHGSGLLVSLGQESADAASLVAAFNRGDFGVAEAILDGNRSNTTLCGQGFLALLGHPAVEGANEERLLVEARQAVAAALESNANNLWAVEANQSLDIFARARQGFHHRGMGEEGHFQENRKVVSLMRVIPPSDLLYWKALEYQGRALQMLDPHRWVYPSGDALAVWRELIEVFSENRYARFYLKGEWEPDHIWHFSDHLRDSDGAPQWAVAQREAWGLLLDVCEWWAANKQYADGSIGGGWGDDVELVALFGLMGFISEGASEPSLDLARKLIDGLWQYGGIDQDAGFYRGLLDAEHSAEWTGDTLPLMLTIDWGNPVWLERATQTARLMRDLWMDYNDRGDLHFKSNFLSSISIGNQHQANDSYINYRAVLPAVAVYRYTGHPEIGKLLVAWADAWVSDAMRTDRGKPRGVFPAEVGFPAGKLGGVNSPNWYTADHPTGTVNYDWQPGNYNGYLVELMLLAREITGDDKYLEPFRLQQEMVAEFRPNLTETPPTGSQAWVAKVLSEGSPRGRRALDEIWRRVQTSVTPADAGEPPVLVDQGEVLQRMNDVRQLAKERWPVLTTETSATDRVGFRGIADPFFIMTGTQDFHPSVTYAGVGRDFSAFVKQTDSRCLRVVLYNFSRENAAAAITAWKLDVGGTYRLRTGIDVDGDDQPDHELREKTLVLERRDERIQFPFAPRATTVVEMRQIKPSLGAVLNPDLAVVSAQIKYSIWTHELQATVHNVGSNSARKFDVAFYEGVLPHGRKIGQRTIPHLSWPIAFQPQRLTVGIPYVPTQSRVGITVMIDEHQRIAEMCESNNSATREFQFDLAEIRAPRNRVGEIGGNVSAEIQRGIR